MNKTIIAVGILGTILGLAVLLIAGAPAQGASSPIPALQGGSGDTINFQGQLTAPDPPYDPVAPGPYEMHFVICRDGISAPQPATCLVTEEWSGTFTTEVDAAGLFNVLLTPIDPEVFVDADGVARDRWLMVEVWSGGWDWMQPNQRITSVALALGYIRKDTPDTTTASFGTGYVLDVVNTDTTIENGWTRGGVRGEGYDVYHGNTGVYGKGWYGVYGYSLSGGYGVYGTGGNGVWGVMGNSPDSYGVLGVSDTDVGVFGRNPGGGATAYGVLGVAGQTWVVPADKHAGVIGSARSIGGIGVFGGNPPEHNGFGVVGVTDSTSWLIPLDSSAGVVAQGDYGVYASANDTTNGWAGHFNGKLYVSQPLYTGGPHFSTADTSQGQRTLAAVESPEVWAEDFGRADLVKGQAVVTIDALFAETVNLASTYHVFLTPLDDCQGLYIAAMTPTFFEVRELGGGTASIAFDYRIVARRQGWETTRLPLFAGSGDPVQSSVEEVAPEAKP